MSAHLSGSGGNDLARPTGPLTCAWQCRCGAFNGDGRASCFECGERAPLTAASRQGIKKNLTQNLSARISLGQQTREGCFKFQFESRSGGNPGEKQVRAVACHRGIHCTNSGAVHVGFGWREQGAGLTARHDIAAGDARSTRDSSERRSPAGTHRQQPALYVSKQDFQHVSFAGPRALVRHATGGASSARSQTSARPGSESASALLRPTSSLSRCRYLSSNGVRA